MKLAFVTNFFVPELGMNTYYLARGLSRLGVDLTMFASEKYGKKRPPSPWKDGEYNRPFDLVRVRTTAVIANVPLLRGLKTALASHGNFDLILTEDAYQLYSKTALDYAKTRGIPLVLRHDLYEAPSKFLYNFFFKIVEASISKTVCSSASSAIVPTTAAGSYLTSLNPKLSIHLIPFGIDTDQFNPDPEPAVEALKEKLQLGEFNVLCVSRLVESKGLFDLLDIISELNKTIPNIRLYLIGRGELEKALRERAAKLMIADVVTFIQFCPHDKIHLYYKMCDSFVLTSYEEAPGLAVPEAMACGRPVVATDIPGVRDYISNGNDGLLIACKDVQGFVRALLNIYKSPDYAANLGNNAARKIRQSYSWDVVCERTLGVLNSCRSVGKHHQN